MATTMARFQLRTGIHLPNRRGTYFLGVMDEVFIR
jgi:hypothetical protein